MAVTYLGGICVRSSLPFSPGMGANNELRPTHDSAG